MTKALFRQEAIDAIASSHLGRPRLGAPRGIVLAGGSLLLLVALSIWQIGKTDYTRRLPVFGIFDEDNERSILSRSFGDVVELNVTEGDQVIRGQYLGRIVSQQFDPNILAQRETLESELESQISSRNLTSKLYDRETTLLTLKTEQTVRLIRLTASDVRLQQEKISRLKTQFERTTRLYHEGYLSNADWLTLQTALITEQQRLNNHREAGIRLRQQMDEFIHTKKIKEIDLQRALKHIDTQTARLRSQLLNLDSSHQQLLHAPIKGRVTRINAKIGETLQPGSSVMHLTTGLVSDSATLRVPSFAAGFINVGQELNLEVDAFPAQRHGRIKARVVHVSDHTVPDLQGDKSFIARLSVDTAELIRGDAGRYLPGMKFRAYISIERKSIFTWSISPALKILKLS